MKQAKDFWHFSKAGRELADLHINYEEQELYPVTFKLKAADRLDELAPEDFHVKKMKFVGTGKNKNKSKIIYNKSITIEDIPLEAYDYIVSGRAALEWVMERQVVKTDKASKITNDANDYAKETMGNVRYPLELFQRVITVSLRTMEIVKGLPVLELRKSTNQD